MRVCSVLMVSFFGVMMILAPTAEACMARAEIELSDVKYANVVVVGRVANYTLVLDPFMRKRFPNAAPAGGYMTDYAKFDILVDEVLFGKAPKTITVTWDNSTFAEPERMSPGPYLIALRSASSNMPPLRGPSATIMPVPEPDLFTLLQAPCAEPFMFPSNSEKTGEVRRILQ